MLQMSLQPCCWASCQIAKKNACHNWFNRNDVMLILYEMLHTCSIMHTQRRCKFENTKHRCLGMFLHKCDFHCSGRNWYQRGILWKTYIHWVQLVFRSSYVILNWRVYTFLLHIHAKYEYRIPFMIWELQTIFSNVSSMKVFEFRLKFHWSLFPRVQLIVSQHWFK